MNLVNVVFNLCCTMHCVLYLKGAFWRQTSLFLPFTQILFLLPEHLLDGKVSGCQCHSGSGQDKQGTPMSVLFEVLPHLDAV